MGSSVILPQPGQPLTGPDPGFKSAARPSAVDFITQQIPPPSPLYLGRDDVLGIVCYSNLAGATINIQGRILLPAGTVIGAPGQPDGMGEPGKVISTPLIQPFAFTFAPTSGRTRNHFFLPLFECFLLGIQMFAGGGPTRGNVFVYVELNRGGTVTTFGTQTLFADYITPGAAPAWPGGRIISPLEGPGFIQSITVTNPAAGAEWTLVVPTGARWRLQSAHAQLVTSAVVANRVPQMNINDPTPASQFIGNPTQSVPASSTVQVSYSPTVPTAAANVTDIMVATPPGETIPAGWSFNSRTAGLSAGDQYSLIRVNVEEWLDPLS